MVFKKRFRIILIDAVVETLLFYVIIITFMNNLLNAPLTLSTFIFFVIIGIISYVLYEIVKSVFR